MIPRSFGFGLRDRESLENERSDAKKKATQTNFAQEYTTPPGSF